MRAITFLLLTFISSATWAGSAAKDIRCLAQNVYFEARGETSFGQLAVAMVTMNRVYSKKYPNSICGVVWQRRQFSWTHDGKSDSPRDKKAWQKAKAVATHVYHNYKTLRELNLDYTKGALHYYAPRLVDPYWARHKELTLKTGGHVFVVEKKSNS